MTYFHSSLFFLHIVFGTAALILFWVPLATKKGQLQHTKFGRAYRNVMYCVAATGAVMAMMVIAFPLSVKPHLNQASNVAVAVENIRYFWLFLLYLALLSYTTTRHGDAVLKAADNRVQLRNSAYLTPLAMLTIGGIGLIVMGLLRDQALHLIFGILGMLVGLSMLRYVLSSHVKKGAYLLEHIASMVGSGIGAYTAFLSFGGRHLLSGIGEYQLLFWIAPGVIGASLSFYLTRKYKKIYHVGAVAQS